jgi:transcriptional regulator with XRE-family HTH domain
MDEADRTCATGLAALRQAAELTQAELARRMGVTQAAVSRMEQPHDLLLSTLTAYLAAVGGRTVVMVRFADGHETQLDLSQRSPLAAPGVSGSLGLLPASAGARDPWRTSGW